MIRSYEIGGWSAGHPLCEIEDLYAPLSVSGYVMCFKLFLETITGKNSGEFAGIEIKLLADNGFVRITIAGDNIEDCAEKAREFIDRCNPLNA